MQNPSANRRKKMRGKAEDRRRREGALERLTESKFFEKKGRTEQQWQKRKDKEIEILEIALGIKQGAKKKREEIILD
jgi:hypothetical protein